MAELKKLGTCKECQEEKNIIGRGLCGKCYPRLRNDGTLDEKYPSTRKPRKATPKGEVAELRKAMSKPSPEGAKLVRAALDATCSLAVILRPFDSDSREAIIDAACNTLAAENS